MTRPPKTPKTPGVMREVIAANLTKLLERDYAEFETITARQRELAKDAKVGFGTIQRWMKSENGGNLDTLETLAIHFDLQVYQLMLPNLDVRNAQVVKGADAAEQRLYANMRKHKRTAPAKQPETATS